MRNFVAIALLWVVSVSASVVPAEAATLGLSTRPPVLEAPEATVGYLEFGALGDLASFGARVDVAEGTSPMGITAITFAIGFQTSAPEDTARGFFFVLDEAGIFLDGTLTALGFTENVIEMQFGDLEGPAAPLFGSSALLTLTFEDPLGPNPFDALVSGQSYAGSIRLAAVDPAVIPLPAALPLLGGALFGFGVLSRRYRPA